MKIRVKRHYEIDTVNGFSLILRHDTVASSFSFNYYFDPNDSRHRLLFQPGHYHVVDVEHNDEILLRGYMTNHVFGLENNKKLSQISGYSLCGILEDVTIPKSIYPIEFNKLTLRQLIVKLLSPWQNQFKAVFANIDIVQHEVDFEYDKTSAEPTESVKDYIASLCNQKDLILSHTAYGNLLVTVSRTKQKPIFHFHNEMLGTQMSLSMNGQRMHSEITVQKQADDTGGNAGEDSVSNPLIPYIFKPVIKNQTSGTDNDSSKYANNIRSGELKNLRLTITTDQWEIDGKVIKPNNIITVINPELYLYTKNRWFIEEVRLTGNEKETIATLTCVLPEVYNGEEPKDVFFFDESKAHIS